MSTNRWGIILAGGDGRRLLPLTRKIFGDDRPKQFCALMGSDTLLEQTRRRVCRMVPDRQVQLVLSRTHEVFYADQLSGIQPGNLLIQPHNHGIAAAIAYGVTRLNAMAPDAVVGFFPSDHHFESEDAFAACVDQAFLRAEWDAERVLLLGIAPDSPHEAYGWIEPGNPLPGVSAGLVFEVRGFWEKPSRDTAARLMDAGCVWNSFVMVGRASAFLNTIRRSLPDMLASFEWMWTAVEPGMEYPALCELFSKIPARDFSTDVLSVRPSDLAVLPARGLKWSDLGEPERVISARKARGTAVGRPGERVLQPL